MALAAKTFSELITFSRASTGTRVNSAGIIESVAANQPRFDFHPTTGAALGLLIEEARTNLLPCSEQFDLSAWSKFDVSVTANVVAAPDGTMTADKLIENTVSASHYVGASYSFASGTSYAHSVYAKAGGRSVLQIAFPGTAFNNAYANFDLASGTAGGANNAAATITSLGGGWYRCTAVATATASTTATMAIVVQTSTAATRFATYLGDGVSGIYVWGAQLEAGSFPTSYIPTRPTFASRASTATYVDSDGLLKTAAINVARTDYDPVTHLSKGLLIEAAATNLLTYSEQLDNASWTVATGGSATGAVRTANAGVAPDGTNTADRVQFARTGTTSSDFSLMQQNGTVSSGATTTKSIWLKSNTGANQQVMITDSALTTTNKIVTVTTSWQRFSITSTVPGTASGLQIGTRGSASFGGDTTIDVLAWGGQLETGSQATSYIPTVASTVTRAADVYSTPTATRAADLASIPVSLIPGWNPSEGTIVADYTPRGVGASGVADPFYACGATPAQEVISARLYTDGSVKAVTGVVTITAGSSQVGVPLKVAFAFKQNDYAASINGAAAVTSASSSAVPSPTVLNIGSNGSNQFANGTIKSIVYYPTRLTNTELQQVTA